MKNGTEDDGELEKTIVYGACQGKEYIKAQS